MDHTLPFLRISQVENWLTWRQGQFGIPGSWLLARRTLVAACQCTVSARVAGSPGPNRSRTHSYPGFRKL